MIEFGLVLVLYFITTTIVRWATYWHDLRYFKKRGWRVEKIKKRSIFYPPRRV